MSDDKRRPSGRRFPYLPRPPRLLGWKAASLLLFVAAVPTACGGGPARGSGSPSPTVEAGTRSVTVEVAGFKFVPDALNVKAGTRVRYVNRDRAAHTVTHGRGGEPVPNAAFDVEQEKEATVEVDFARPAEFPVTCRFHPTMNQTVTVSP